MPMMIDGPITTESVDSSGEILKLEGLDISDFTEGRAYANWEHEKDPESLVGIFTFAKKIFSEKDCENDRQLNFWKQLKTPFLYGICTLFEDEEHAGAVAIASIIRYFSRRTEKVEVGFSVEGQTLKRDGHVLERTVGRRCAITLRPCNRQCWIDVYKDTKINPDGLDKSENILTVTTDSFDGLDPIADLKKAVAQLEKTLTAGGAGAAPSQLVGGAALAVEDRGLRNRVKSVVRDWDRKRPLKEMIKAALPELAESFVDHFTQLAEDLSLKKGLAPLIRIDLKSSSNRDADEAQQNLVTGLYFDFDKPFNDKGLTTLSNDAGQSVLARKPNGVNDKNNTAYYQIASNLFGLGKYANCSNYIEHPSYTSDCGNIFHIEATPSNTQLAFGEGLKLATQNARESQDLCKLSILDIVMGVTDRHVSNVVLQDMQIKHIDNFNLFNYSNFKISDQNANYSADCDIIPVETNEWLQSLDAKKLAMMLSQCGINKQDTSKAVYALKFLQRNSMSGTVGQIKEMLKNSVSGIV